MIKSHNVLFIESITVEEDDNFGYELRSFMSFTASLNYSLQLTCPITGNKFRELKFQTQGHSCDYAEAEKQAIQNMLDGRHSIRNDNISCCEIKCKPVKEVHYLEVSHFPDEIQQMFRQLFDISSWQFELKGIEA